jgi:hypothetical protein
MGEKPQVSSDMAVEKRHWKREKIHMRSREPR